MNAVLPKIIDEGTKDYIDAVRPTLVDYGIKGYHI